MPNRLLACCLLSLTVLLTIPPSRAEIGVIDNVPAATLLLPYFEVDLANTNGVTTLFSITLGGGLTPSDGATAHLVQVTLWTDLGIPTFAFNIYLTGYDTQSVDLRDVFNGNLPITASAGQDPTDTLSPHGPLSQDINFASCNGTLPYPSPALNAAEITALRNAHTGKASTLSNNQCSGFNHGDNIARGYLTIDAVNQCQPLFTGIVPGDTGYFGSGGSGVATNQNNLWGDFFLINAAQNFAQGESLIALEASTTLNSPGTYTFYGRLVNGAATDNREPLATHWAAPFEVGPGGRGTDLLVWRDPGRPVSPFACGGLPAPFPLGQNEILAFDIEENPTTLTPAAGSEPFPLAAARTTVGASGAFGLRP
ncbi:MAG: hypothetical protein U1F68_13215 [Gammaproteobacteria bacterium]